jgi:3-deoxy-D-manno-octulosonic-acid transferase
MKRLLRHQATQAVLVWLGSRYLRFALRTTRWTLDGAEHLAPCLAGHAVTAAFWHERLALMPALWLTLRRTDPDQRGHVLVSRHRDGQLIGAVMRRFGVGVVHGSTRRGGAAAARAARALLARGEHLIITPDGPRGPRRIAAPGVAQIAALAGVRVLPCAAQTVRRSVLRTWDRMIVPLPFSRGVLVCLPPIAVPRDAGADPDHAAALRVITTALTAAADRADALCEARWAGPRCAMAAVWAAATTAAAPALRLLLWRRLRRGKEIAGRLAERRGIDPTPRPPGRLFWLHAASVGETVSILPVLAALTARAPDLTVLLTTGTVTSAGLLAHRLEAGLEERILHRFVPLDVPAWAARFLDHWRPDAAGFVESELWPNLLLASRRRGIPVMLLNARMSERSLASWRRVPGLARHVLSCFVAVRARAPADAARLQALGAPAVSAPGDLKFAAPPLPANQAEVQRLQTLLAGRPVWLAASTHPGEEALVLDIHRALAPRHPGLLTILVPRHPERGAEIAALADSLRIRQRSQGGDPPPEGIWLADTLGELGLWYRLARIVFVGRSLLPPGGGQNPLEPARLGCAVAVGPYTGNFQDAVQALQAAGALTQLQDAAALTAWIATMLAHPDQRQAAGAAGIAAAARWANLPDETAEALLSLPLPLGERPAPGLVPGVGARQRAG